MTVAPVVEAPARAEWVDPRARAVAAWFGRIASPANGGGRASMARLRRCASPEAAACEPETFELAKAIRNGKGDVTDRDLVRAGFVAGILAHVREDLARGTFGAALATSRKAAAEGGGPAKAKGKPRLSKPRFVRLCDARNGQEAFAGFRRAVAIVDEKVPVQSLAGILLDWFDDRADFSDATGRRTRADAVRIRLAREYCESL